MNTYFQPAIGVISFNSNYGPANFASQRQMYLIVSNYNKVGQYNCGSDMCKQMREYLEGYKIADTVMKIVAIFPLIAQIIGVVRIVNALRAEAMAGPIQLKREQILRGVGEILQLAPILLIRLLSKLAF